VRQVNLELQGKLRICDEQTQIGSREEDPRPPRSIPIDPPTKRNYLMKVLRRLGGNPFYERLYNSVTHLYGRLTRQYYFEDFVRVYPNGIVYNRLGDAHAPSQNDINNFLNHQKFYFFASQFVSKATVADVGCGSGYGCEILKNKGASVIEGSDISPKAIAFAQKHYGHLARFTVQGITDLRQYPNARFDVTISSEVLEHIKEYHKEKQAINELKRITKPRGVIILGTPNSELLGGHGFYFEEMKELLQSNFSKFCLFENALMPPEGEDLKKWQERQDRGLHGVIVTQNINLSETVLFPSVVPQLKQGLAPGFFSLDGLEIDTSLLHNTHSWIVVAINN
jgi:2-polyprenyl-3-methyl-5-hydroxy-6-metoxy-1,4-benzoquinol methylase